MKPLTGLALATLAALLTGCGGGGGSSTVAVSTPSAATTAVQVNLGDAPSDRLLAASMHVQSLSFANAGGSIPVLAAGVDMEVMQSMGTARPLVLADMPQGTYASATMTFSGATVTYIDPASGQAVQRTVGGPMTATVNFSPPLAVGSAPMVVNFDLDMSRSLTMDGGGNTGMTPFVSATWRAAIAGSSDPEDGGMGHMTGVVSGVSGNALRLGMLQGANNLPVMTNAATEFVGIGGMAGMGAGMLAAIDGVRQPDGTWIARRVRALTASAMAMGVVTEIFGSPPTQLVLAMQDGAGLSMMPANLAGTTTVALTGDTSFGFDTNDIDLGNLPFTPRFDAATLRSGQRVAAFSNGAMMQGGGMHGMTGGGSLAASSVQLVPQGLRGTVSGYAAHGTQATFTLTVAADSAFATLTGSRSVTVYQQPGTRMAQSIADDATVIARGLLFIDNGAFRLVATRIAGS